MTILPSAKSFPISYSGCPG